MLQVRDVDYWPEINKKTKTGPLVVTLIEEKEYAFHIERKLSVSNKEVGTINNTYNNK